MNIRHPFLFLLFVALAALVFQTACPASTDAMTATPAGPQWVLMFQAHVDNVSAVIVTECQTPGFFAYDSFPILDPAQSRLLVRRQPTPKGARCTVLASIMRQVDEDPNHDVIGESIIVIQKKS